MIPFWTSSLIRLYGWIIIFRAGGVFDSILMAPAHHQRALKLLYTYPAVVVGMVYALLPFMIFSVYSSAEKLDFSLVEAARDLGASPVRAFLTVSLKLTLPGLLSGVVLTFVPSMGLFFIADILGRQQGGAGGQLDPGPADEGPQLALRGGAVHGAAGADHGDYLAVPKDFRREGLGRNCIIPPHVCPPQALRGPSRSFCDLEVPMKNRTKLPNIYLGVLLALMYVPILLVIIYSFNESKISSVWEGLFPEVV